MAAIATVLVLTALAPAYAAQRPHRIVSLNLCTDQLLWRLADRGQIASLSYLAADPSESLIASRIKGVPLNYGHAEEVRLMDPDLVLAGTYGARMAVALLKARGFKVVEVPPAMQLSDIALQIETVGKAIGQEARADAMAARVRLKLKALAASRPNTSLTAVVFQPRGFAAGAPSLANDVLALAGARNLGAEAGFKDWVPLGIEGLLDLNPQLVVIDSDPDSAPSISDGILHHPALRYFLKDRDIVRVPSNLWACGTEETLGAVALIRAAILADRKAQEGISSALAAEGGL